MFGCIGGLFRFFFFAVVLALLGGAAYYYLSLHPEKAPWKGGVASVSYTHLTLPTSDLV